MSNINLPRPGNIIILAATLVTLFRTSPGQTPPVDGIRKNTPAVHAFTNARIIPAPGKEIVKGTLVIRDGVIESVGMVTPPKDARIWDMKGMTLYPGLIDGYSTYGMPAPPQQGQSGRQGGEAQTQPARPTEQRGPNHWNPLVLAQQSAAQLFVPDEKAAEKLRAQGITNALAVPTRGIFRGTSALVSIGDGTASELIVKPDVAQHVSLNVEPGGSGYPNSLMGVIALIRQTFYDADWYAKAHDAYRKNTSLPRPEVNDALASLGSAARGATPVIIETGDELSFLRADKIGKEFSLNLMIRGSGQEYRRLDAVRAARRPVILPVNFPETPLVNTPEEALQITLEALRHWDEAPENPKRLAASGIQFAFTSSTLKDPLTLLGQARKAVERGLSPADALASLTTTPAKMFGVGKQLGSLEAGKLANFIITDGDLFVKKTKIRETWIDGKRYEVKPIPENDPRGKWNVKIAGETIPDSIILSLKGEVESLQGSIKKKKEVKLTSAALSAARLALVFTGDSIGFSGVVRMTANVSDDSMIGTGEWSDGKSFAWSASRIAPFIPEPDTAKPKPPVTASFPPNFPHGEFGRAAIPDQSATVLVKNATIWTSGEAGNLESSDMLVQKGKIVRVGRDIAAPAGAVVIDAKGKHVTAGLIDAHSHMAASGSVNESGQAITAEVRVEDVIDSDDIDIYRALAGGLTAAHILHGSANPIGGQAQLIKMRWGALPDELKVSDAPPTIKFALGENVKQSNWPGMFNTRYPQTRMGVDQIIRDEFIAALDYKKGWERYSKEKSGIPPRRDLELDAIVEILDGKRFIHCHSYRQDEILALIRLADELGFKVRVFQHILEGYKVADEMAKHGAGGSSFSDWWAYKLEVYDAIPHNGALMHEQGVLVSFNSDSDELARRMNLEAAKAVKYGNVPQQEALKFVTLNPAKQLMVEHRIGSLEPGKDADFVIWSGSPLSPYSVCEQTWVDGRKYFDREEDRKMQDEVRQQRAVLVQKALTAKKSPGGESPQRPPKQGDAIDHPHQEPHTGEDF